MGEILAPNQVNGTNLFSCSASLSFEIAPLSGAKLAPRLALTKVNTFGRLKICSCELLRAAGRRRQDNRQSMVDGRRSTVDVKTDCRWPFGFWAPTSEMDLNQLALEWTRGTGLREIEPQRRVECSVRP